MLFAKHLEVFKFIGPSLDARNDMVYVQILFYSALRTSFRTMLIPPFSPRPQPKRFTLAHAPSELEKPIVGFHYFRIMLLFPALGSHHREMSCICGMSVSSVNFRFVGVEAPSFFGLFALWCLIPCASYLVVPGGLTCLAAKPYLMMPMRIRLILFSAPKTFYTATRL